MVTKIVFENNKSFEMNLFIEASAESLIIPTRTKVLILFDLINNQFEDDFSVEFEDDLVTIYETRQHKMTIIMNDKIVFETSNYKLNNPIT